MDFYIAIQININTRLFIHAYKYSTFTELKIVNHMVNMYDRQGLVSTFFYMCLIDIEI